MAERRLRHSRPREHAVAALSRWIADGNLVIGERLPPEQDLARRLGVSRTTLRTALDALADERVVERATRSGRRILSRPGPIRALAGTIAVLAPPIRLLDNIEVFGPSDWQNRLHGAVLDRLVALGRHALIVDLARMAAQGGPGGLLELGLGGVVVGSPGPSHGEPCG